MRYKLFLIFGLILLIHLNCSRQKQIKEAEIYLILNQIISDDSLRFNSLNNKFSDFRFSDDCIKSVETEDLGFMINQMKIFKGFSLKDKCLKEYWPRDKQFHYIKIDSSSNDDISIPLISLDRDKVLINISKAGQTGTYLYIRTNGKWIRKDVFNIMVE